MIYATCCLCGSISTTWKLKYCICPTGSGCRKPCCRTGSLPARSLRQREFEGVSLSSQPGIQRFRCRRGLSVPCCRGSAGGHRFFVAPTHFKAALPEELNAREVEELMKLEEDGRQTRHSTQKDREETTDRAECVQRSCVHMQPLYAPA